MIDFSIAQLSEMSDISEAAIHKRLERVGRDKLKKDYYIPGKKCYRIMLDEHMAKQVVPEAFSEKNQTS